MAPPSDIAIVPVEPPLDVALVTTEPPLRADQNPYWIYLNSLAPRSRPTMVYSLRIVAELLGWRDAPADLPWWGLRYPHLQKIRAELATRYAPAGVNKTLVAVRRVLYESRRCGKITGDDYANAVSIKAVPGSRVAPGRALAPDEVVSLQTSCELARTIGARDRALVAVLAGGGLRREEASSLNVASFNAVAKTLTFIGKGNKERVVPLPPKSVPPLTAWLAVRGPADGALFHPVSKSGRVLAMRRLTGSAIRLILMKLATRAGLAHFSPHDLRRTLISELLDRGADISVVSSFVGHESIDTTKRYDRRGEKAKRAAANLLDSMFADTHVGATP